MRRNEVRFEMRTLINGGLPILDKGSVLRGGKKRKKIEPTAGECTKARVIKYESRENVYL